MLFNENEFAGEQKVNPQAIENTKPEGYRVTDEDNSVEEKDLERSFLTDNNKKTVMEGQPMGGQMFNKNNLTPAGDDKNNPSQNAGYDNAYFARTEPSEEHPEDTNFKAKDQDGAPDYAKAQPHSEAPKPEPVERGNGENDRPHEEEGYQEGTADNDGQKQENIPGPIELPDQQKVGEPDAGNREADK